MSIEIRIDENIRVIFTEMLTDVDYDLFWKGIDEDVRDGSDGSYSETVERIHGVCSSVADSFDFQIWYAGQNSFAEFTDVEAHLVASTFQKEFPDLKIEFTGTKVDKLLEEWIVVELPSVEDESAIRMTRRSNFEKMDYCKAYNNYGVQVDCDNAGCYTLDNSGSDAQKDCSSAITEKFGVCVSLEKCAGAWTIEETNDEEEFSDELITIIEAFIKEWQEANESHTESTGWTYHDGSNFITVTLDSDFGNYDCVELDEEEQIAILLQYPGIPHIEGTNASVETEDYVFYFDRWATNPWTCYVERK